MRTLETCVWHASDWIAWVDRSGFADPDEQRLVDLPLAVTFDKPPRDLSVVHKPGRTVLWRAKPDEMRRTVDRVADDAARARPAAPAYLIQGEVADPAGRYLPRRFLLSVGTAAGRTVSVFRTPAGTRYNAGGGAQGRVVYADGLPAAWAVVELDVTPPLGGTLPFVAQADHRGEFRMALDRLPALTRDAPVTRYPAVLRVRASRVAALAWRDEEAVANPDLLPVAQVGSIEEPLAFAASASLEITPGEVATLASAGSPHLSLQSI